MAHDPLDPASLIGHVKDTTYFQVPRVLTGPLEGAADAEAGKWEIPQLYTGRPIYEAHDPAVRRFVEPFDLQITRFMVLEVVAALIVVAFAVVLSQKLTSSRLVKGRLWNAIEAVLLFIRDEVARPAIGAHDADRFLPYLWTIFFFVLTCNLLGMVPWLGSPTGALGVTGTLALMTFASVVGAGSRKLGAAGFWKALVPHMDLPLPLAIFLKPMLFLIEVAGLLIKHFVLSVRLLANMFAGHLVLGVLVAFVAVVGAQVSSYLSPLFLGVSVASIFGSVALSLLELFVAFLQAYIFTFLSALFIGMAVHPH